MLNQNNYGSPMQAGATNPQQVRSQIAQDLNQGQYDQSIGAQSSQYLNQYAHSGAYQPAQNQQYYKQGAFQQVMNAAQNNPQAIRAQIEQDIRQGNQPPNYSSGSTGGQFGSSMMSQFGTNPQSVRRNIQQDLSSGQGAMSSAQAGAMQQSNFGGQSNQNSMAGQSYQSSMGGAPGGYNTSQFAQFGSNAQSVQQDIQNDMSAGAYQNMGAQSFQNMGGQSYQSNMAGQSYQNSMGGAQGGYNTSQFAQYGSNAQSVQQDIQNDMSAGAYQNMGAQSFQNMGGQSYQSGMGGAQGGYNTSQFSQFGSNPQSVQQDIQNDMSAGSYQNMGAQSFQNMGGQNYQSSMGGAQGGYNTSQFAQFASNVQSVQQDISQDLNQNNMQ